MKMFIMKLLFFPKTEDRKVKQVLSWGWYQWRAYKERA
jgi:hypothetical protein